MVSKKYCVQKELYQKISKKWCIKKWKLPSLKKMSLPDGRRFMPKCEQKDLPPNVTIRRQYKKELVEKNRQDVEFRGVREKQQV